MNIFEICFGGALVIAAIVMFIISIVRTPTHLRGYYGVMYFALTIACMAGGIALLVFGIMGLIA